MIPSKSHQCWRFVTRLWVQVGVPETDQSKVRGPGSIMPSMKRQAETSGELNPAQLRRTTDKIDSKIDAAVHPPIVTEMTDDAQEIFDR